jgi:hypothetical protein
LPEEALCARSRMKYPVKDVQDVPEIVPARIAAVRKNKALYF